MCPTTGLLTEPRHISNYTLQGNNVYEATTAKIHIEESLQEYCLKVSSNTDYLCNVNLRPLNIQETTYQVNMKEI